MNPIQLFWWRVRYAWHFWKVTRFRPSFCWGAAVADESYRDDYTPSEAVNSELSYWAADSDG